MQTKLIRIKNDKMLQWEYYCPDCKELLKTISFNDMSKDPIFTINHECAKTNNNS